MEVTKTSEAKRVKKSLGDVEELKEVLSVVADRVPALIKGLVSSIFSEDSAANMGKAAATYYKELKAGGIPDDVAVKMTRDYVGTFTKISEFLKSSSRRDEDNEEIKSAIRKKLKIELGEDEE